MINDAFAAFLRGFCALQIALIIIIIITTINGHITVRCSWLKNYCLSCVRSVTSSLSSIKTTLLLIERTRHSAFWNERHLCLFAQTVGHPTAHTVYLNSVDYNIRGEMQQCNYCTKCITSMNWSSSWSIWHGHWSRAKRHRRRNDWVAQTSRCVFAWKEDNHFYLAACNADAV